MATKSSFLDKVLGRIARLDAEGLQNVVQRLARERGFLETLFNTIEDGVLVVDETGRILYFIQALTLLAASVAHEIGNPLNALHIHLQLMERELRKLSGLAQERKPGAANSEGGGRLRPQAAAGQNDAAEIGRKLEQYVAVAKGE